MKKKPIIISTLLLAVIVLLGLFYAKKTAAPVITSFEECAKAGNPIMESYPRRCRAPDGRTYVEELTHGIIYVNASADMVTVELPFPGAVMGKSFSVIGKARGMWFFEASFPIEVLDLSGTIIARGIAQAQDEWMTENFVPFKADIVVPESYIGPAILLLKKDNPSGLPEHDASIHFPITITSGAAKDSTRKGSGMIRGRVIIGPICPVERPGIPCPVPPEAYTSRTIVIYAADGKTEVTRFAIGSDGAYSASLVPGSYVLGLARQGIDRGSGLPHSFVVSSGSSQEFDFSIDTGIR